MKKIVFVIPTMRMGGAEQSLVSLLNSIDLDKYQVDLLLFERKGELLEKVPNKVTIREVDVVTRAMILEFRYYFKELVKTGNISAIIARLIMVAHSKLQAKTGKCLFFSWNLSKLFIKPLEEKYDVAIGFLEGATDFYVVDKINAKKKIGWIHSDILKQKRNYKNEGKYYKELDVIPIITRECKHSFIKCYPELSDKVCIIPNISNKKLILEKAKKNIPDAFYSSNFCIVTVGRLEEAKGIDIAIHAAEILKKKGVQFVWHVFGDGSQREYLQNMIKQKELADIFMLEGTTSNPYKYMRAADAIVQSSRYEGKSIVLDEAKILGKPIIVTDYPSAKDQIIDGETGIIVDINENAIADGIERLIYDETLRNKLAYACKNQEDDTDDIVRMIYKIID